MTEYLEMQARRQTLKLLTARGGTLCGISQVHITVSNYPDYDNGSET
jgi:hypothetical protein